jgi:ribosome maturation factor RimP
MITEAQVRKVLEEQLEGSPFFLVDVVVKPGSIIDIEVDKPEGITIGECREISKKVEAVFDREQEDFELTVSSPGLEKPFRVPQQYWKNVGRSVTVELLDGNKLEGKLILAQGDNIEVESRSREKVEGKKSKQEVIRLHQLNIKDIKQTKVLISFK